MALQQFVKLNWIIGSSAVLLALGGGTAFEQMKLFPETFLVKNLTNLSCNKLRTSVDPYQRARLVTVSIFSSKIFLGSGTLFQVKKSHLFHTYQVVTNRHLFDRDDLKQPYLIQIKTSDARVHIGSAKQTYNSGEDLIVIEFKTNSYPLYEVAVTGAATRYLLNKPVFAAGWIEGATSTQSFTITTGTSNHRLSQPLQGGYQLGYTNAVLWGMSGGPVLDSDGNFLGINAIAQNNNIGGLRKFEDKSIISPDLAEIINQHSWAIPTERLERFVQFSSES